MSYFFYFLSFFLFWIRDFTVYNAIYLFLCSTEVAVQWIITVGVLEMAVALSIQLGSLTHGHPLPQKIQDLHQLLNKHTSRRREFTSQTQKGYVLSMLCSFMGDCDYEYSSLHFGHNCDILSNLSFTSHFAIWHHIVWDTKIVVK